MSREKSISPLEYEILEEKVASLMRVTKKMDAALTALCAIDEELARTPSPSREKRELRSRLFDEAAELVWYFVVQREALGLLCHDSTFEDYGIPDQVRRRMGPRRRLPDK